MISLLLSVLLLPLPQAVTTPDPGLTEARRLIEDERFVEAEAILRDAIERNPQQTETTFLLGHVLAKQGNPVGARELLEKATALDPGYVAAYIELAGVAFEESKHEVALRHLRRALELEPDNAYALNFIATLNYLDGSQIEALDHWNRIGAPRVEQIAFRAGAGVHADVLERLFPFNKGEILRRSQVLQTRWTQERLGLEPAFRMDLNPSGKDAWDLEVTLPPRSTLSFTREFLIRNALRAPLYQEIRLAYPVELTSGREVTAAIRWDAKRKRAETSVWLPFLAARTDGLRVGLVLLEEDWRHVSFGARYIQQMESIAAEYEYVFGGRKSASIGVGFEHQFLRFAPDSPSVSYSPHLLRTSMGWSQRVGLNAADTMQLDITGHYENYSAPDHPNQRQFRAAIRFPWLIDRPSDTQFRLSLGAGISSSALPLSHYFVLGVGQDDPLPLRAHPTVQNGYNGYAPMGRNYVLQNLELRRHLFNWKLLTVTGLMFSDTARVWGPPFGGERTNWFQDAGIGIGIGAVGMNLFDVRVGRDVKTSSFNLWIGLPN